MYIYLMRSIFVIHVASGSAPSSLLARGRWPEVIIITSPSMLVEIPPLVFYPDAGKGRNSDLCQQAG